MNNNINTEGKKYTRDGNKKDWVASYESLRRQLNMEDAINALIQMAQNDVLYQPQQPIVEQDKDIEHLAEKTYPDKSTKGWIDSRWYDNREAFKKGYKANIVNKELVEAAQK